MKGRKIIIIRVALAIIIGFITCTIFNFSNQNAEKSSGVSGKVAEALIDIQPKYKDIAKEEKEKLVEAYQHPIRKLAHFTIYTALGISIALLTCTFEIKNKKRILITLISGVTYAISDEIHQLFIPGRSGQVTDVLIDSSGVLLGAIVVMAINKLICKKYNKSKQQCHFLS